MLAQSSKMFRRKGVSAYPLPLPSSQQVVQTFHPFPLRDLLGWDLNASTHSYSHGLLQDKFCNVSYERPEASCLVVKGKLSSISSLETMESSLSSSVGKQVEGEKAAGTQVFIYSAHVFHEDPL